jgi:hypothetical protein
VSNIEIGKLQDKIIEALVYSSKKMFEEKLKNDSIMAISHKGKIIVAKASEIAKLPE